MGVWGQKLASSMGYGVAEVKTRIAPMLENKEIDIATGIFTQNVPLPNVVIDPGPSPVLYAYGLATMCLIEIHLAPGALHPSSRCNSEPLPTTNSCEHLGEVDI